MLVCASQRVLHVGIKNPSQNYMCSKHLPGHPFLDFMLIVYENNRFGDPFRIQWGAKCHPKSSELRRSVKK